jgi:hypothetical protein
MSITPEELEQAEADTFARLAEEAARLGNPITAEALRQGFGADFTQVPDGYFDQLLAAQRAAQRALSPPQGNRQQRRAARAQARRTR